mgnify:CR=1 FL=1
MGMKCQIIRLKKNTPFLFLRLDRHGMVHFPKKMVKLLCKEFTFSANIYIVTIYDWSLLDKIN